jgi:hypothetical protein
MSYEYEQYQPWQKPVSDNCFVAREIPDEIKSRENNYLDMLARSYEQQMNAPDKCAVRSCRRTKETDSIYCRKHHG